MTGPGVNAMADNTSKKSAKGPNRAAARQASAKPAKQRETPRKSPSLIPKPVLLSGGNPQIAKGDGDAPVQAYIAAMPDWKGDIGRRLDAIIVGAVPGVHKA